MLTQDQLEEKINEIEKLIEKRELNIAFNELEEFFLKIKDNRNLIYPFEEEKFEDFEIRIKKINQFVKFLFELKLQNKDVHKIDKMLSNIKTLEKKGWMTSHLEEELTRSLVQSAIKSENDQYLKRAKNLNYRVFVDELIKIAEDMVEIKDEMGLKAHINLIKFEVPDLDEQTENLKRVKHVFNKINIEYDELFKINPSINQLFSDKHKEIPIFEEKLLENLLQMFQDSIYIQTDIGNKICYILKRLYNREEFLKKTEVEIRNQILDLFELIFEFKFNQDVWNNWNITEETLSELNNFYFHLDRTFAFLIKKFEQKNLSEARSMIYFLIDKFHANREKKIIDRKVEFKIYHFINIAYDLIIENTDIFENSNEKFIFFLGNLLHKIPFIHNLTFFAIETVFSLLDPNLYSELINFEVMKNLELIDDDRLPNGGAAFIKQNLENLDKFLISEIRDYCNLKNLKRIEHYIFNSDQNIIPQDSNNINY